MAKTAESTVNASDDVEQITPDVPLRDNLSHSENQPEAPVKMASAAHAMLVRYEV